MEGLDLGHQMLLIDQAVVHDLFVSRVVHSVADDAILLVEVLHCVEEPRTPYQLWLEKGDASIVQESHRLSLQT